MLSTGILQIDWLLDGGIRPGLTLIHGQSSTGKTSLLKRIKETNPDENIAFFDNVNVKRNAKECTRLSRFCCQKFEYTIMTVQTYLHGIEVKPEYRGTLNQGPNAPRFMANCILKLTKDEEFFGYWAKVEKHSHGLIGDSAQWYLSCFGRPYPDIDCNFPKNIKDQ